MYAACSPHLSWSSLPKKAIRALVSPFCAGSFDHRSIDTTTTRIVTGKQGHILMGNVILLHWLVDTQDGTIIDAKFQAFGHPYLTIFGEIISSSLVRMPYAEAYKISADFLNQKLSDSQQLFEIQDTLPPLHFVLDAIDDGVEQCADIPLSHGEPLAKQNPYFQDTDDANPYSDEEWVAMSPEERLTAIRNITKEKIEPFILMDGGSISVDSLDHLTITVSYSGNCSGCMSAVGSTLQSIQALFTKHIYPHLIVRVNESSLSFLPPNTHPES